MQAVFLIFVVLLTLLSVAGAIYSIARRKTVLLIICCLLFLSCAIIFLPPLFTMTDAQSKSCVMANMHTMELTVSEYQKNHGGKCPSNEALLSLLPVTFTNPDNNKVYDSLISISFDKPRDTGLKRYRYMLGYGLNTDSTKYVIMGFDKNGIPIRSYNGSVLIFTNMH